MLVVCLLQVQEVGRSDRYDDVMCVCFCCRCKKWDVPIEKVYNKTQREKFAWAIDMATEDYKFTEMDD